MRQLFRKPSRLYMLPMRNTWHDLGGYTSKQSDTHEWKELMSREAKVAALHKKTKDTFTSINWEQWMDSIQHQDIVKSMQLYYEGQVKALDVNINELKQNNPDISVGWHHYHNAVQRCKKSVDASDKIITDGARVLWVSARNPPAWNVSPSEWLDTDQYWQAYIEKHHHYDPAKDGTELDAESFEDDAEDERRKKNWNKNVDRFHDRTDTPILYQYVDQQHSSDYYDIHRRAFAEHMTYYLLRTGGDYRFFPEIPPFEWVSDIENLRYKYISVTHRRRAQFQLMGLDRELPLDMQPTDYEHHGEEFHLNFLNTQTQIFELLAAKFMANYILFSHPFVPIQTQACFRRAINYDDGQGQFYHIGEDVNALFYLPNKSTHPHTHSLLSPLDAFNTYMDHLTLTDTRLDVGYAAMMDNMAQIVQKRGTYWFSAPGESMADAFLRRLRKDDPSRNVYEAYVKEMKERFSNAKNVSFDDAMKQLNEISKAYETENEVFKHLAHSVVKEYVTDSQTQIQKLKDMHTNGDLINLLDNGALVIQDPKDKNKHISAQELINSLQEFEAEKLVVLENMQNTKVAELEKK